MDLKIDRQALVPVVQQIVNALAAWIHQENSHSGTRLPSIRQLARDNLLSQSCVIEAYERMVAQGLLTSRQGSGFFVAEPVRVLQPRDKVQGDEEAEAGWGHFTGSPLSELRLGCGWLPESWRESDDLSYAIRQITRTDMTGLFNYSTPLGLPVLRQQLQKHLKQINICVDEGQILTTHGASHALDLVVRTLLKPGDCVVIETPGFSNLHRLLKLHGIALLEVPRTSSGPQLNELYSLLENHKPRALFINSLYHNPTGSSLAPTVAQRLLQLATSHDFFIVEDDVFADLQKGACTRLAALDADERVIYVASFSKTLSSSLRLGYITASAEIIARLAEVKMITCLGVSRFCESVMASLLATGAYHKLAQRLRQRLNKDMLATLQTLEDAEWEVFTRPAGGMFIWARPGLSDYAQVREQAGKCGVSLSSGVAFNPDGAPSNWLRINVAYANDPRALAFFRATALPDRPQPS
ncbi:PLP-dependent aminotransferase family protein [Pseudomonas sp. H11T01]|uniref:aminotransferase-like domain-containing protein n=1 Tax=Pseudomonas sp. H11T01 TaxID=3402749 RepID=UPI003AC555B9